jgi:hypothetical protein
MLAPGALVPNACKLLPFEPMLGCWHIYELATERIAASYVDQLKRQWPDMSQLSGHTILFFYDHSLNVVWASVLGCGEIADASH